MRKDGALAEVGELGAGVSPFCTPQPIGVGLCSWLAKSTELLAFCATTAAALLQATLNYLLVIMVEIKVHHLKNKCSKYLEFMY